MAFGEGERVMGLFDLFKNLAGRGSTSSGDDGAHGGDGPLDLVVVSGPNAGQRFLLEGDDITVGRMSSSTIQLNDDGVSRRHASIRLEGARATIEDLGSASGVEVNGTCVREARLRPGDRLRIGQTILEVEPALHIAQGTTTPEQTYTFNFQAASDEQKIAWLVGFFQQMAAQRGGNVVMKADGDMQIPELQLGLGGCPTRLKIDLHWFTPELELRVDNQRGLLTLERDVDRQPPDPHDAFADHDDPTQQPLAPNVFVGDELYMTTVRNLEPGQAEEMARFVDDHRLLFLLALPDSIQLQGSEPITEFADPQAHVDALLQEARRLAEIFGQPGQGQGALPGVYINGQRVESGPTTVTCTYCNAHAVLDERARCNNCGAPLQAGS